MMFCICVVMFIIFRFCIFLMLGINSLIGLFIVKLILWFVMYFSVDLLLFNWVLKIGYVCMVRDNVLIKKGMNVSLIFCLVNVLVSVCFKLINVCMFSFFDIVKCGIVFIEWVICFVIVCCIGVSGIWLMFEEFCVDEVCFVGVDIGVVCFLIVVRMFFFNMWFFFLDVLICFKLMFFLCVKWWIVGFVGILFVMVFCGVLFFFLKL